MPVNSFDDFPMSWRPRREALPAGPVYLALAAQLETDISGGSLAEGTRLPPQRELADFLDLNFTTVTRAYEICRQKGLIRGVVGRGTFVAARRERVAVGPSAIDCAVVQGFPSVGGRLLVEAARAALARPAVERLFTYGERDGQADHRAVGVRWLARCGVEVSASGVSVFPGVQSALSTVLLSLFRPGDGLAVDRFTYSNLIHLARLAHVRLVPVDGDRQGMRPEALRETVAKDRRLRGVFLMPACANPTTVALTERRRDALAKAIREAGLVLLEDDVSLAPAGKGLRPLFARLPEQTVYLSGTVRVLAPGLRVSFIAYPARFATALTSGLHHLAIKASALEADILSALIAAGKAEEILALKAARARAANAVFDGIFGADGGDPTRLFRIVACPGTAGRGEAIERELAEKGVRICHSDRFAVRVGEAESFVRVSVSSAPSLARLREALRILSASLPVPTPRRGGSGSPARACAVPARKAKCGIPPAASGIRSARGDRR